MGMLWKRMDMPPKNWRGVFKALSLLEFLLKAGSQRVAEEARERIHRIRALENFTYDDPKDGSDKGSGVRTKAEQMVKLLRSERSLRKMREGYKKNKSKFSSVSSEKGYGGSGAKYGGYGGHGGGGKWGDDDNDGHTSRRRHKKSSRYDDEDEDEGEVEVESKRLAAMKSFKHTLTMTFHQSSPA
eukprot:363468-Amorphochlora_amoeboformis.AAC.2